MRRRSWSSSRSRWEGDLSVTHLELRWLDSEGELKHGGADALGKWREEGASWVWADITDPDEATMQKLGALFDFHELAMEDAAHQQHRAKLDSYPHGLFLVWMTPGRPHGDGISQTELDVFIGKDHLVTAHAGRSSAVETVAQEGPRFMRGGPDWTVHAIVDLLVDATLPLADEIGEKLFALEDRMLGNPRQEDLRALHRVRRQLVRMHRIVAPERDVVRGLARESDIVSESANRYFQDIGDHLARVLDEIETYQDVGESVMDVFLSAQNNRMNEIMKQLTVVATIFMPLTLISGIYGMNLIGGMFPPAGQAPWAFWAVILFMVGLSVGMAVYFRKKEWW